MERISSTAATLKVDWESGIGRVEVETAFAQAPAGLRRDALRDWTDELDMLLELAVSELEPHRRTEELRLQRERNLRRRLMCERLEGQTIVMAEPLVNGDVMLHLGNGEAVVLYAYDEDVKLEHVNPARARRQAEEAGLGDYYVREDAPHTASARSEQPAPSFAD